jgi:hypothetical protein
MKRVAIGAILIIQGWAFAHEGMDHSHKEDAHMEKLHKMMPMFA